jgi:putative membrane protein
MRKLTMAFCFTLVAALAGGRSDANPRKGAAAKGAESTASMKDAQVLGVLVTANQGEIDFSQAYVDQASDPQVKSFAQMMIKHHTDGLAKTRQAATDAKITVDQSDVTRHLESDVKTERTKLASAKTGQDSDLAYMCAQIRMHQGVLTTIDNKLTPAAQDAKVKTAVSETRPVVASHLDQAKQIVQKLSGGSVESGCKAHGGTT